LIHLNAYSGCWMALIFFSIGNYLNAAYCLQDSLDFISAMFNFKTVLRLIVAGFCMLVCKNVTVIHRVAAKEIIAEMKH